MRPWHLLAALGLWVTSGCEKTPSGLFTPPTPMPDPLTAAPLPAAAATATEPQALDYVVKNGIGVTSPEVVWQAGRLEFSTQEWKIGDRTGKIWRVLVGEGGGLEVVPSEEVKGLGEFEPKMPEPNAPYVMINGGFYERIPDVSGYRPMGVVRTGGKTHKDHQVRGGSGILTYQQGAGVDLVHQKAWKQMSAKPSEALQSIDRLVDDGASLVNPKPTARQAARSAIALSPAGTWFVVASSTQGLQPVTGGIALGRTSYTGMTLEEFARYLVEELGAKKALNLDGAVSTQMRVWHPEAKKTFEIRGERGTINAVVGY